MRILHFTALMQSGGTENFIYNLILNTRKSLEYVALLSYGGKKSDSLSKNGIKSYVVKKSKIPFVSLIRQIKLLKKIVKEDNIDIIHTHHRSAAFIASIYYRLCNNKIKLIHTMHNDFYNRKRLTRFSFKHTKVVACGYNVYENLQNYFRLKNITLIQNSVPIENIPVTSPHTEFTTDKNNYAIVNVGRLTKQKDQKTFIKAIPGVLKEVKNVLFYLVGDGQDLNELIGLTREIGVEKYVKFLGFRDDMASIYGMADVIVLSSLWEGLPLTIIEGFAYERVVIASNIPSNYELIKDDVNGILFETGNYIDLATKITYILQNPSLKNKFIASGKDFYNHYLKYDKFVESYLNQYKMLLEGSNEKNI